MPEETQRDNSEPATAVEESPQEPEVVTESQPETESTPTDISKQPNVDEGATAEERKIEDASPSDPGPSSDDVKEEESAPVLESVEASAESGKTFPAS